MTIRELWYTYAFDTDNPNPGVSDLIKSYDSDVFTTSEEEHVNRLKSELTALGFKHLADMLG